MLKFSVYKFLDIRVWIKKLAYSCFHSYYQKSSNHQILNRIPCVNLWEGPVLSFNVHSKIIKNMNRKTFFPRTPLLFMHLVIKRKKTHLIQARSIVFEKKRGGGRGQNYPKILTSRKNPENPNPLRVGHIPTVSSIFCSLTYFHLKFFTWSQKVGGGGAW